MKLMYDPFHSKCVGDGLIESTYLDHTHDEDWFWTGQHELIFRARLGLMRGEISELTLRVFDYENDKARMFHADQDGQFDNDEGDEVWHHYIVDNGLDWAREMARLRYRKENECQPTT